MSRQRRPQRPLRDVLAEEGVVSVATLGKSVTYEDSEECVWEQDPKTKTYKCVQRSGKKCKSGSCKSIAVTIKQDGEEKTVVYCECA